MQGCGTCGQQGVAHKACYCAASPQRLRPWLSELAAHAGLSPQEQSPLRCAGEPSPLEGDQLAELEPKKQLQVCARAQHAASVACPSRAGSSDLWQALALQHQAPHLGKQWLEAQPAHTPGQARVRCLTSKMCMMRSGGSSEVVLLPFKAAHRGRVWLQWGLQRRG